jgi:hypothetical protein
VLGPPLISILPMLSILWLYEFPNWLFCTTVIAVFVGFALGGQAIVRRFLPRWFGDKDYNDIVGQFLSASGVFFGITLGLLSVGAWENFSSVETAVTEEANVIGVLYRVVDNYPEPHRAILTEQLRDYVRHEIDTAWPKQRLGIAPGTTGNPKIARFFASLSHVEPSNEAEKLLFQEGIRQFTSMVESRRLRIASVSTQLPPIVWMVVFGGSVLNLSLMWLFVVEKKRLHDLLTAVLASLLGLLVFLLAVMDFPFRGEFSVGPDSFELVYQQLMVK